MSKSDRLEEAAKARKNYLASVRIRHVFLGQPFVDPCSSTIFTADGAIFSGHIKEANLQLRQIEATERLADEMAENNRLLREASRPETLRVVYPKNRNKEALLKLSGSVPKESFDPEHWEID